MDALAELRARQYTRMIEETDDVCKGCERRHTEGAIAEFFCTTCHQKWVRDTAGVWVHPEQAHGNCRRKPCPYCKALDDADRNWNGDTTSIEDDRYYGHERY